MSFGPFRLLSGGRIDREQPLSFSVDGRALIGFHGDTLASALLARGVTLVGRSFKYHRPRGFMSAGVEEPNGLFTLGVGNRTEPNIPATTTELIDGLVARRQNGWPSVALDFRAVYSLAAPALPAGFYYKTFMAPTRGAWMRYEPFIRRAAGLGRAVHARDPDRYERRHAFTDVLVVGAGPAGLGAALCAAKAGVRVVLVEQDWLLGGGLLLTDPAGPVEAWRRQIELELESLPNVEVLRRTTAAGLYEGNAVALVTRREHLRPDPDKGEPRQILTLLRARTIVFATGAIERPLTFPNNDRPGIMLASAVRTYLNRFAVACGRRVVVLTNNDSAYATAFDLAPHVTSVSVVDLRRTIDPSLAERAREGGIEVNPSMAVLDVHGGKASRCVTVASLAAGNRRLRRLECDLICISGGWSPTLHLTSHGGIKPRFRDDISAFVPGGYAPGQFGAGSLTGCFSLAGAIREGIETARSAVSHCGYEPPSDKVVALSGIPCQSSELPYRIEPLWQAVGTKTDKAFVDFQNDVTVGDLTIAHREGYGSVEHLKRYTTLGMGTDQGKTSNVNALAIVAGLRGVEIPASGTTTFRPPYTPVTIGALAGRCVGRRFRPTRRSPLHAWHLAHGAVMTETGPWLRPWFYRWAGATVERACREEMRLVRHAVGMADVSTLGKIDVQGPDAGEFLDRVYVNGFANLPVGRARYGVMLTDDGVVLDDGTTTRLSDTRYFMTTSTAQADEVLSRLEFLLDCAWTDLRVHATSVTDQWSGMVVAGPRSRIALEAAFPRLDLSNSTLPRMACLQTKVDGIPLRIIRLSFSGELAYEIYAPAGYAVSLWQHMLSSAEPVGIRPYGLEALASLRIEKGHVAGLEIDHRNTLQDLGLGGMAKKDKPFVGRELLGRPQLNAPERWSLVGIESRDPGQSLRAGAILFSATDKLEGHGRGYVTSVTWSIELERFIALGLYQGGLKHAGEEIVCAYPLKGERVRARIVSPVFVDPKGERLRV